MRLRVRFDLRIAHGLRQHLAQLGLGLRGFSLQAFLPLGHPSYVVMPERELKPVAQVPSVSRTFLCALLGFRPCEAGEGLSIRWQ